MLKILFLLKNKASPIYIHIYIYGWRGDERVNLCWKKKRREGINSKELERRRRRKRVTVSIVGCSSNRFTRSSYHTVRSLAVFRLRGYWGSQVRPLRPQPRGCRPIWRPRRIRRRPRPRSRHRRRRFWNRPTCSSTGRRRKRRRIVNRSPSPTRGWGGPSRRRRNSAAVPPTSRPIPRGGRRRSSDTWVYWNATFLYIFHSRLLVFNRSTCYALENPTSSPPFFWRLDLESRSFSMSKLEVTVFLNLFYKGRRKIRMLIERRKEGRYDFYDRFKEGAPFSDTRSQTGGRKRWVRSKPRSE